MLNLKFFQETENEVHNFQPWMMITNAIIMTGVWATLMLALMGVL